MTNEIEKIIYISLFTGLVTVLSGSIIFVIKELISKFLLEPIREQKQIIAEVTFTILNYDSVYFSIWDIEDKYEYDRLLIAKKELSEKGSRLISTANTIPFYCFWRLLFRLPSKNNLLFVGLDMLEIGNRLGKAHFPQEAEELSNLKFQIMNKLRVKLPNRSD
jgi:hypothetical protein